MGDSEEVGLNDRDRVIRNAADSSPRVVDSGLPEAGARHSGSVEAPGRTLAGPAPAPHAEEPSNMQRAVNALRFAVPIVQRVLPLLDRKIGAAVSSLLVPHPHPAPLPPPPVNLAPIGDGLADLQTQHQELRSQVSEQNASLERIERQLEIVRETADRNTLAQQELVEGLRSVSKKVRVVTIVALALLAVSVLLNLVFYLHIQRVLH